MVGNWQQPDDNYRTYKTLPTDAFGKNGILEHQLKTPAMDGREKGIRVRRRWGKAQKHTNGREGFDGKIVRSGPNFGKLRG